LIGQWKQIEHCESDQECLTGCTLKQGGQGKILKQRLKEVVHYNQDGLCFHQFKIFLPL
jgi:hypothetical protein